MGKLSKVYLMPHPPIMVHEVGKGREEDVSKTIGAAMEVAVEVNEAKPDTIIIIVPPHGPAFGDAISISSDNNIEGNLGNFGAPDVKFEYEMDLKLVDSIMRKSAKNNVTIVPLDRDASKRYRIPYALDHGSTVPLYFINKKYESYKLVHITYGLLSNEELYHFGRILRESVEESDRKVVIISSGDLSHRLTHDAPAGFSPLGEKFDKLLVNYLKEPAVDEIINLDRELVESAGECGYRSILIMLGALDGLMVKGKILSYEGPFGVGYCVAGYDITGVDEGNNKVDFFYKEKSDKLKNIRENEGEYAKLARESLEHYIKTGKYMQMPKNLPEEMITKKAGTFVSIKKNNELRGCIGTIEGVQENVAKEIIQNAISAGTGDPRFYPVEEDELYELVYSVDVLEEPELIESRKDLDPKRYGVIVRKGERSGLLLPNLEGVDTVDEQLRIVLRKAGINEDERYSMERFEVIRHR